MPDEFIDWLETKLGAGADPILGGDGDSDGDSTPGDFVPTNTDKGL